MTAAASHHLPVQGEDDLTVGPGLELVVLELRTDVLVVVYLAVDSQHLLLVGREQRLPSALRVYDAKALMGKYCGAADVYAAPVRTAVADLLAHPQGFLPELRGLFLDIQD